MKKSIIKALMGLSLLSLSFIKVNAEEVTNNTAIGYTIDCVGADSFGNLSHSSFLARDYRSKLTYKKVNCENVEITSNYSMDRYDLQTVDSKTINVNNTDVEMFTNIYNDKFDNNKSYNNIYFNIKASKTCNKYYLDNFDLEDFKSNLSENYLYDLDYLSKGELTYEEFFRSNGTHLVTSFYMGGYFYESLVVKADINESMAKNINDMLIDCYKNDKYPADRLFDFLENDCKLKNGEYSFENFNGSNFPNDGEGAYIDRFFDSLNENLYSLVKYDTESLIPIWEILPDNSPVSKEKMEEEFIKYANDNKFKHDKIKYKEDIIDSGNLLKRDTELKIIDNDRFNNIERFNIDLDCDLKYIKYYYSTLKITVTLDYKKLYKGNRYIYLYDDKLAYDGSNHHDDYIDFEKLKCEKKNTLYNNKIEFTVNLNDIDSLDFALVYRASGKKKDTWINNNISIDYSFEN